MNLYEREVEEIEGFDRFTKGLCPAKLYVNFFDGLLSKTSTTGVFINTAGFALIAIIYNTIGNGKYWKILFYAGVAGAIGALIENGTTAYVCRESDKDIPRKILVPYFLNEVFWIVKEYAVPILNLIKLKAFNINRLHFKIISITVYVLGAAFVVARFYIGYQRMVAGLLTTKYTRYGHTAALSIAGFADLICSAVMIITIKQRTKKNEDVMSTNYINQSIKRSNYITILVIDVVSIVLAFLNAASEAFKNVFLSSYITPFHCLKTSFVLILACDALLFKFNAISSKTNSTYKTNVNTNNNINTTVSVDYNSSLSF